MLPAYKDPLLRPLLLSLQDPLPSIRASALSNIAILARMLKFGLHPYLGDLLRTLRDLLVTEKEAYVHHELNRRGKTMNCTSTDVLSEVKRGAVFAKIRILVRPCHQ
jgi:hypothetical protein